MAPSKEPVLLDNCAISACVKAGGWTALAARYRLETVQEVEGEATTGSDNREIIDPRLFRSQVIVHPVSALDRNDAIAQNPDLGLIDRGESDLWVHALGRSGGWILCGPDIASIRLGVRIGHRHRLISLEKLLEDIGFRPRIKLEEHQTEKWLQSTISKFAEEMLFEQIGRAKTTKRK